MATVIKSPTIAGVTIVEPDVHGDERGLFVVDKDQRTIGPRPSGEHRPVHLAG